MCDHKWKVIATINYESQIMSDGFKPDQEELKCFVQDKIYECQECLSRKVVTRAIKAFYKHIPDWFNMCEGLHTPCHRFQYCYSKHDKLWVISRRALEYPDFPEINLKTLKAGEKTTIKQTIIDA